MTLGLIMYFYYGITHSTLENPTEEIELAVDQSHLQPQPQSEYHQQTTAVWDRHGYENKMAEESWSQQNVYTTSWGNTAAATDQNKAWGEPESRTVQNNSKTNPLAQTQATNPAGGFKIFVDESEFPKWD